MAHIGAGSAGPLGAAALGAEQASAQRARHDRHVAAPDQGHLWDVVELTLHPGQEAFVAPNIDSIANAYVAPTFVPLAVYAGEALAGFAMYSQHPETGAWWVIRLMLDREHQGQGYGRAAMEAVIAMMAERVGRAEIVTSFNPANAAAATLYASLGFRPTGEIEDDEPLVLLRLGDRPRQADP